MVQLVNIVTDHDRMSGVGTALITHHQVHAVGHPIDQFSFGFVTPL
jgi:hypothetical protein